MTNFFQIAISIWILFVISSSSWAATRDVVVASDCGTEVDDQWAIIETLLSPELKVKGFMSTHAPNLPPPAAARSAECINNIVHNVLKLQGPLVYEGSSVALSSIKAPIDSAAAKFLLHESLGHTKERPLIIISLGAVTDIASALIADPTLSQRAQVWMMGFGKWPQGGKEWNIANDGRGASVILESNIPVVVLSSDTSTRYLDLTFANITSLLGNRKDKPSEWLYNFTIQYLKTHAREFPGRHKVFYDIGILAALFNMTKIELYNRPHLNRDYSFNFDGPPRGNFAWVESVQANRLWADLANKLDAFSKGL